MDVLEDERILVLEDGLVGKHLEDLLKSGLADTILLDAKILLLIFKLSEEPSNGFALLWNSELVEVATLLEHLNLTENISQERESLESKSLGKEVGDEVHDTDVVCSFQFCLQNKVFTNAFCSDLVQNKRVIARLSNRLNGLVKFHLFLDVSAKI